MFITCTSIFNVYLYPSNVLPCVTIPTITKCYHYHPTKYIVHAKLLKELFFLVLLGRWNKQRDFDETFLQQHLDFVNVGTHNINSPFYNFIYIGITLNVKVSDEMTFWQTLWGETMQRKGYKYCDTLLLLLLLLRLVTYLETARNISPIKGFYITFNLGSGSTCCQIQICHTSFPLYIQHLVKWIQQHPFCKCKNIKFQSIGSIGRGMWDSFSVRQTTSFYSQVIRNIVMWNI